MKEIEIIGGGFIKLLDKMGSDLTVVNAARVSFNKRKDSFDQSDEKLINFLAKNDHWTPFSQCQLQFHVKMPIFVARQHFKSSIGITRNEVSRRYVKNDPDFWVPKSLRKSAENVKQGSSLEEVENNEELIKEIEKHHQSCNELYEKLLKNGVCAEQSRVVLPQSMMTEFIETGSLSAYARIYGLRAEKTAQLEIQEYAKGYGKIISDLFPVSWNALTV
jgi:thymidylate synthase (FAD)